MISSYQSALSALHAFSMRLHSNSYNIANISTEDFDPTRVLLSEHPTTGVKTNVERVGPADSPIPDHTVKGHETIPLSNVNLIDEMVGLNLNSLLFRANLRSLQATDQMFETILDIKA